ncbi:hypothetical protein K439DRAFT_1617198 [Ramaria rubella]|nr:hypothetical protein K439DRAFT_1617198 [Ramaria rubella]
MVVGTESDPPEGALGTLRETEGDSPADSVGTLEGTPTGTVGMLSVAEGEGDPLEGVPVDTPIDMEGVPPAGKDDAASAEEKGEAPPAGEDGDGDPTADGVDTPSQDDSLQSSLAEAEEDPLEGVSVGAVTDIEGDAEGAPPAGKDDAASAEEKGEAPPAGEDGDGDPTANEVGTPTAGDSLQSSLAESDPLEGVSVGALTDTGEVAEGAAPVGEDDTTSAEEGGETPPAGEDGDPTADEVGNSLEAETVDILALTEGNDAPVENDSEGTPPAGKDDGPPAGEAPRGDDWDGDPAANEVGALPEGDSLQSSESSLAEAEDEPLEADTVGTLLVTEADTPLEDEGAPPTGEEGEIPVGEEDGLPAEEGAEAPTGDDGDAADEIGTGREDDSLQSLPADPHEAGAVGTLTDAFAEDEGDAPAAREVVTETVGDPPAAGDVGTPVEGDSLRFSLAEAEGEPLETDTVGTPAVKEGDALAEEEGAPAAGEEDEDPAGEDDGPPSGEEGRAPTGDDGEVDPTTDDGDADPTTDDGDVDPTTDDGDVDPTTDDVGRGVKDDSLQSSPVDPHEP